MRSVPSSTPGGESMPTERPARPCRPDGSIFPQIFENQKFKIRRRPAAADAYAAQAQAIAFRAEGARLFQILGREKPPPLSPTPKTLPL